MHEKEKREDESRKRRKRSRSRSKDRYIHKESKKSKSKRRRTGDDESMGEVGDPGTAESLSIDETNKLRAKLGLTPLDLGSDSKADSNESKSRNSDTDFVHAPAKDLTKAKQTEKLQEKIAVARERRELLSKLREVKSLGSGEETSVSSWVEKMRSKEKAKLEAEKREQMLIEMDAVFGVSAVVAERVGPKKPKPEYSSASLEGLKVEHSVDRFPDAKPIILTLKDSDVLAEDVSDVLTNVNLEDEERAEMNRENKRKLAGLGGILQDEDEDVVMGLRQKGILEKYDVEISGPKKAQFMLEVNGTYATDHERALRRLQEELQTTRQSVEDQELRPAADFYTVDEMAQFKKKKKRKVQRRVLRADDLISSSGAAATAFTDHGSRRRRGVHDTVGPSLKEEGEVVDMKKVEEDMKPSTLAPLTGLNPAIAALLSVQTIPEEEEQADGEEDVVDRWIAEPLEPDNLQLELEKTLSRVRNANLAKSISQPEERLQMVVREAESEALVPKTHSESSGGGSGGLVFDATAEFFKQISGGLQNDVTAKMVKREEDSELEAETEAEAQRRQRVRERDLRSERLHRDSSGRYVSSTKHSSSSRRHHEEKAPMSKLSSRTRLTEGEDKEDANTISFAPTASAGGGVFEEEPTLNQGVFSALLLAQKKGYVEEEREKERPMGQLVNLMAKHYVKEDVRYDDIDAKFAKRERYNGPLCDFREKSSYKPDVKLYYVDEMGRNLTPKEAFRQLSHKFHGKGSGKKKTERRTKKIIEEAFIKNSAASDTPLGTLDKLNKKLEKQGTPYVVLSGKGSATKSLMK